MRPVTRVLVTASLAMLAVTTVPTGAAGAAADRTAAPPATVSAEPVPKQDWIYTWTAPVRRQESWCDPGTNPIVCHTQYHTLYPTVTITAVRASNGASYGGSGSTGVATVHGVADGCYQTTISVSGLGRYISRNEAITMQVSRRKKFLVGGGVSGVKRFTLADGNHTYRECA